MNTITCVCLLVCVSVAYAGVVPEETVPSSVAVEGEAVDVPISKADESLDGQESRWGYGGGWGRGGGWGYGGGWGGRGYGHYGGYGGRGWGHGGGWGYGWGR